MSFIVSIKHITGHEVQLRPGGHAERELVEEVLEHLKVEGVGWFKSEAKVLEAVSNAIKKTLFALKSDVKPFTYELKRPTDN